MPHPEIRYATFSPQESLIYRITEKCFRTAINKLLQDGSAASNYTHIFVFLLRLRQCASHPFMLEETMKECWGDDEIEMLKEGLAKLSEDHTPFYEQCAAWVKLSGKQRQARKEASEHGTNASQIPESMPFGTSDFGHHFKMHHLLTEKPAEEIICSICGNLVGEGTKTSCEHIFCQGCLESIMHRDAAADGFDCFVCPYCDKVFTAITPFTPTQLNAGSEAEPLDFDDMSFGPQLQEGPKGKRRSITGPGTDELGFEPSSAPSSWLSMIDRDPNAKLVPSTKITVLKSLLLEAFQEAPMDKVVVYVQFRLVARIIGRMCKKENWKFVYLTGDATLEHRANAISMFREKDDVRILIAGLRCGGLGLNLAFANRCISLDLWWNHAVERQAFGRIFRLGQAKETRMTRIAVRDTIDMRFLSVQVFKMTSCDKAMEERAKLGLAELVKLFGFIRTIKERNILQVEADYVDEAMQETPEDGDQILSGKPMGGDGTYAGGDWSFGDRTGLETNAQNIASGSGNTSALESPSTSTSTLASGPRPEGAFGHSNGPLLAPDAASAASSGSAVSPGSAPASIWGPLSASALVSVSASSAGVEMESSSTSVSNADSGFKSNPIKTEDYPSDISVYLNYEKGMSVLSL
jgi:SNF2 family DNA or RNA helicase